MHRVKIAVIGLGGQGRLHVFNCLQETNIELRAIADRSKSALSRLENVNVKKYVDYHEMLQKENLDAVIVALPSYLHEEACLSASENRCDILVEKPLATTVSQGKRIADQVRKSSVNLMIGMNHRFAAGTQKLKREIDAYVIGRAEYALALSFSSGPFSGTVPDWYFDKAKVGGILLDTGSHLIDLLLWFFGDVSSVLGLVESKFNLGYEDHAEAFLKFKNGVRASAVMNWHSMFSLFRVEVIGQYGTRTAGTKTPESDYTSMSRAASSALKANILRRIQRQPVSSNSHFRELSYFVHCILNDKKPKPDANDGVRVLEVIDQVYKSASLTAT